MPDNINTTTHSWSRDDVDAIAKSMANLVEAALRIGNNKLNDKIKKSNKLVPLATISRTTPRTTVVRMGDNLELVFEITVRRRW